MADTCPACGNDELYDDKCVHCGHNESEQCDHDDYHLDILTGLATCSMCPLQWYATQEEKKRHEELMAAPYPDNGEGA